MTEDKPIDPRDMGPADMAARTLGGGPASVADIRAWQGILHAHGWGAIHWPVEFGGLAATPAALFWRA